MASIGNKAPATSIDLQVLATKANQATTYTKTEVDGSLAGKFSTSGGTISGAVTISGGGLSSNGNVVCQNGDMYSYRSGGTTGVIFLTSDGSKYLYWDGSQYSLPGGPLALGADPTTVMGAATKQYADTKTPKPQIATGVGQFFSFNTGFNTAFTLPTGGTWAYFFLGFNTGGALNYGATSGVNAGGTVICSANASIGWQGFVWRIA